MKLLHHFKVYGVLNGGHLGQATAGGSGNWGNLVFIIILGKYKYVITKYFESRQWR